MIPKKPVFHLAIEHEDTLRAVFHLSGCFCVCWGCSARVFLIVGLNGWSKDGGLEMASTQHDYCCAVVVIVVVVVVVEDDALLTHVW